MLFYNNHPSLNKMLNGEIFAKVQNNIRNCSHNFIKSSIINIFYVKYQKDFTLILILYFFNIKKKWN